MPLVLPLALDTCEKKPANIGSVSFARYNRTQFRDKLIQFQDKLGKNSFSLMLGAEEHAINLNYDCTTKRWLLIDPNLLPGVEFNDLDKLAEAFFSGFPGVDDLSKDFYISMEIYTTNDHSVEMKSIFYSARVDKTPMESFLLDYKDAKENGSAVIKEKLASKYNLALIIPDQYWLRTILETIKEEDQPVLIHALSRDIISLLPDIQAYDYIVASSILKPAGRAALIALQGEHLCSIILNKTFSNDSQERRLKDTVSELKTWHSQQESSKGTQKMMRNVLQELKLKVTLSRDNENDESPSLSKKNRFE